MTQALYYYFSRQRREKDEAKTRKGKGTLQGSREKYRLRRRTELGLRSTGVGRSFVWIAKCSPGTGNSEGNFKKTADLF